MSCCHVVDVRATHGRQTYKNYITKICIQAYTHDIKDLDKATLFYNGVLITK